SAISNHPVPLLSMTELISRSQSAKARWAVRSAHVLSRGLISGHWQRGDAKSGDFRAMSPRFQEGNVERNLALVEALRRIADAKGVTVAQIAIAWVAAQGEDIVPLIGARRRDRLAEALGSQAVDLDAGDISAIESAVPKNAAAGARYPEAQLVHMDSERQK
ncbi:aldo/keto reductase, partial [Sinorhizobium medicae]|uniref:aldo/keto reductase n=1 Tax=Sinorhizobium medicae TaxID=110321 RepID=UPI001F1F6C9E